jgi:hypothetical protein
MAHIVPKQVPEYLVDCSGCYETIAYHKEEVQELYDPGWREPRLKKSWIVCPCCGKNVTISKG